MGQLIMIRKSSRPVPVAKANRDQNSSVGATIVLRKPTGEHLKGSTQARTGAFAGKSRGVGRHQTRDQNSTPGSTRVRTPSLREINGKFAGQGQGVKVFHPAFSSTHRAPRTSKLQHWTKGGDAASKPWVAKGDIGEDSKLMDTRIEIPQVNRVGRRVVEAVEKAAPPSEALTSGFMRLARDSKNPAVSNRARNGFLRQQATRMGHDPSPAASRMQAIGEHNNVVREKGWRAGDRLNRHLPTSPVKQPYLNRFPGVG